MQATLCLCRLWCTVGLSKKVVDLTRWEACPTQSTASIIILLPSALADCVSECTLRTALVGAEPREVSLAFSDRYVIYSRSMPMRLVYRALCAEQCTGRGSAERGEL